jgi:3',5'-cyclic AMP phosphodiesterase CpdA
MNRISVLHLSDLHFASPDSNFRDDNKAYVKPALRASYFRNLHRMLKQCFVPKQFAAVAITGDVTTHGNGSGFEHFKVTRDLISPLTSGSRAICMVPGNHDVTWNLDASEPDYFDRKFQCYRNCVAEAKATTSFIPTGTIPVGAYGDLAFTKAVPGPLFFDEKRRLAVLCINSAMRCGEINSTIREALRGPLRRVSSEITAAREAIANNADDNADAVAALGTAKVYLDAVSPAIDKHSLFDIPHVTHTQLDQIVELLIEQRSSMKDEWADYVKIALIHHHLAPFDYQLAEYKPFEVMADASSVLETLTSFGFQTILTGHKHQDYIQRLQSRGTEVLVLGGMTVGGYAVTGSTPSIRHLDFEQAEGVLSVRIADLPCNFDGDIFRRVRGLIENAREEKILLAPARNRSWFPARIESAAEDQLYGRPFFKENVIFDIEVSDAEKGDGLIFETRLSYTIVNRTSTDQEWRTEYNYDRDTGTILEAKFNDDLYDPEQREFQVGRGLSFRRTLCPHERGKIHIHARESWPVRGGSYYTSYHPATDLKVLLRSASQNVEFDFEVLYFSDARTIWNGQRGEVHLDRGLLPYQGVRLNWKRKEKKNGAT